MKLKKYVREHDPKAYASFISTVPKQRVAKDDIGMLLVSDESKTRRVLTRKNTA